MTLSATIEVVDPHEQLLGSGRFTTDHAGYTAMRAYAKSWPGRLWACRRCQRCGATAFVATPSTEINTDWNNFRILHLSSVYPGTTGLCFGLC